MKINDFLVEDVDISRSDFVKFKWKIRFYSRLGKILRKDCEDGAEDALKEGQRKAVDQKESHKNSRQVHYLAQSSGTTTEYLINLH